MAELIYNATIINEGRRYTGWLLTGDDGLIADMGEGVPPAVPEHVTVSDLEGRWLLPGVIDSHVHFREPGLEHKATIYSESRAAAAGGVTSYMEMPNTNPATTTSEALADKYARAEKDSAVNYAFYIGATRDNLPTLCDTDYTRVPGIKLFMGSSTGGMLVDGAEALRSIFSLPTLIAVHCEQEEIVRENMERVRAMYPEGDAPVSWHPDIRSALACYTSTRQAVELARELGTRLHVMHLTTEQELDLFTPGDVQITAEACVAHLLFTDDDYARLGTRIKCNPAVKSNRHREALRKAVAEGRIATVSTDHAPHTLDEKMKGGISAPSGMPMVQYSLPVMLNLADTGLWTPETVVERMAHAQARLFAIDRRGFLRPGYYADMVEVDPESHTIVNSGNIRSLCGWSPLENTRLKTEVKTTWVNGRRVYEAGRPDTEMCETAAMPLRFNR